MSETKRDALGAQCFELLAAMGWSDGTMEPEESEAIVRAAREEGLEGEALARVESAVRERRELEDVDVSSLGARERLYTYALASWVARVDGNVAEREVGLLAALGVVLRLTPKGRTEMEALVQELVERAPEHRPGRLELGALSRAIGEKVDAAARRHSETAGA